MKFKNIEFLKFIFAIGIVISHFFWWLRMLPQTIQEIALNSNVPLEKIISNQTIKDNLAFYNSIMFNRFNSQYGLLTTLADFFFIISGFFLYNTIIKYREYGYPSIGEYVYKKLARLYPVFAFYFICFFVSNTIFNFGSYSKYNNMLRLLLLGEIIPGANLTPINGLAFDYTWYVPTIFWTSIFYFYIFKNFDFKKNIFFIFMLTYFTLICYLDMAKYINSDFTLLIKPAFIRGLSTTGLGFFIGAIYSKYKIPKDIRLPAKIFITAVEVFIFLFLIKNMLLKNFAAKNNNAIIIVILFFCVLLYLFINRRGVLSKILEKNFSTFLGKYSYSIYITHGLVFMVLKNTILKDQIFVAEHLKFLMFCTTFSVLAFAVFTYHAIEKPIGNYLTNKYKSNKNR